MAKKSSAAALQSSLAESLEAANKGSRDKEGAIVPAAPAPDSIKAAAGDEVGGAKSVQLSAAKIVDGSMLLAAGAGAIPLPGWDMAAVTAVQVKMIADLSAFYGLPFTQNLGKTAVIALLGGLAPGLLARGSIGVFLKILPGVGSLVSALAQPAFAAAVTYGVGRIFISHFESGGTLLTFDARNFKETLSEEVRAGMKKVSAIRL